jgi:hypothetical protein
MGVNSSVWKNVDTSDLITSITMTDMMTMLKCKKCEVTFPSRVSFIMAIDEGITAPSTPLGNMDTVPPKGTYSYKSDQCSLRIKPNNFSTNRHKDSSCSKFGN